MKSFDYFKQITQIPRPSADEQKIAEYLTDFARKNNLEFKIDNYYNVIIKKNNNSKKTIILQAHTDMVCEKEIDCNFDFANQGIVTKIDGDFIFAEKTTLGADDGAGVALILYALENFGQGYPNIEAIFTTQEETGMDGAKNLDMSSLQAKMLLSLDGTSSDTIDVSCAGSFRFSIIKNSLQTQKIEWGGYKLIVKNLLGGHSGEDIHKSRANANIIAFKFLSRLEGVQIKTFFGGNKLNAIPRDSICEFYTTDRNVYEKFDDYYKQTKTEYANEPNLQMELTECDIDTALTQPESAQIIELINQFKNGVWAIEETTKLPLASINLANIKIEKDNLLIQAMPRYNSDNYKQMIVCYFDKLKKEFNLQTAISNESPYFVQVDGILGNVCNEAYTELFQTKPTIQNIHAGLEGGVFADKIKGLEIKVIGADLYNIHTPNERLKISSLSKLEKYIELILKKLEKIA